MKDTIIRWTYSIRKLRATGFMYLKGSLHLDAEGTSQLRSWIHDEIINSALGIAGKIDKLELYRQFPPIRVKDTNIK